MSNQGNIKVSEATEPKSSVLVGRFDYALDGKKRFTIPSTWRAAMGNPAYVYVMPDRSMRCLNLIPPIEMESRLEKLREKALFDKSLATALQTIGEMTEQLMIDIQGRIRVCDRFLQFANLSKTVAMVGAVRVVKLWSPDALSSAENIQQTALGEALDATGF